MSSAERQMILEDLEDLPKAQRDELIRDHIDVYLYEDPSQDPNGVVGAAAYTDGASMTVFMDTGIANEALRHECFHTFDLDEAGVCVNPEYQAALQRDLNKLSDQQFRQLAGILADEPVIFNSKFGNVPIGDIAAEQYAGLTGPDESGYASAMVNWLPESAQVLKRLCEIGGTSA